MKKTTKRLTLHKETLQQLGQSELARVNGGTGTVFISEHRCVLITLDPGCVPLPRSRVGAWCY